MDTRGEVADLVRMKDPADAAYRCSPARFVRATRAVAPPSNMMGVREAIGETEFEPQQILGYAPVEPDGSFKLHVPADAPLALLGDRRQGPRHPDPPQLDPGAAGRAPHLRRLPQPAPRRGDQLRHRRQHHAGGASCRPSAAPHQSGETMAALRTRLDPSALDLQADLAFTDVWADIIEAGRRRRARRSTSTTPAMPNPADDLATAAPANGIINYPAAHRAALDPHPRHRRRHHLHQLPRRPGQARPARRHLRHRPRHVVRGAAARRPGDRPGHRPAADPRRGRRADDRARRRPWSRPAPAAPAAWRARAGWPRSCSARRSRPAARRAPRIRTRRRPRRITRRCSTRPRSALITEWMDLGGQYYNDPFDGRRAPGRNAQPGDLRGAGAARCCGKLCVRLPPAGGSRADADRRRRSAQPLRAHRQPEGDYNVTLSMISNTCDAASNYLLSRPSTVPHPAAATAQTTAVLPVGSAGYTAIASWISTGCPTP